VEIILLARSALCYGSNALYAFVGDYREHGLAHYGDCVKTISITAYVRGRYDSYGIENMFDQFETEELSRVPGVRFFRKKTTVDLKYETKVVDPTFLHRHEPLAVSVFLPALAELAQELHRIDRPLRKAMFDLARFHDDVGCLLSQAPRTDERLRSLEEQLKHLRERRLALEDWPQRLGIEWEDYHPAARALLDDEFFWSPVDCFSPHGNDTGADLLSDFKKWSRRHPTAPAYKKALALLKAWEIQPIDLQTTDELKVRALLQADLTALELTDDAIVAAAFASAKCRGFCDTETREHALRALERSRIWKAVDRQGARNSQGEAKLKMLQAALNSMPAAPTEFKK
jgi:uncharacterized protein YfeS